MLKKSNRLDFSIKTANIAIMKSWKTEVCVDGKWATNALRFASQAEAEKAGRELLSRWWVPTDSRAAEADEPVNYVFDDTVGRPVRLATAV